MVIDRCSKCMFAVCVRNSCASRTRCAATFLIQLNLAETVVQEQPSQIQMRMPVCFSPLTTKGKYSSSFSSTSGCWNWAVTRVAADHTSSAAVTTNTQICRASTRTQHDHDMLNFSTGAMMPKSHGA